MYQSKTLTLLLQSKILEFETLSCVHLYRIEYIFIVSAADQIVPALVLPYVLDKCLAEHSVQRQSNLS